jgi:hypothetical protein
MCLCGAFSRHLEEGNTWLHHGVELRSDEPHEEEP